MSVIGIDSTKVRTSAEGPEFRVGTRGCTEDSSGVTREFVYVVSAGGVTGAGYVCLVDGSSFDAVMATTTESAPGTGAQKMVGLGMAAIAAGGYGWLQVYGPCSVRVAASAAAYTTLNSTATSGQLDDDATAGAEVVEGLALDVAAGGSAATVAGFANYPHVGRTL